jgi:tetratricopeptide (TPR) repeat protein
MRVSLAVFLPLLLLPCCALSQEELDQIADYRQRAALYYGDNDLARAEDQARRGLEIDPENGELQHLLGRTLLKRGDPTSVQRARGHLELAYDVEDDFKTAYSLGEYHLRHAELLLSSAAVLEMRIGDMKKPDPSILRSMEADIKTRKEKAEDHLTDALTYLNQALGARQEWVEALQHLASTYAHLHRDQDALDAIQDLCGILQRSRNNKNSSLTTQQFKVPEEQFWRDSLMRDIAWEVEARGLAASILMNGKRWREAETELTAILNLAPDRANEYFNRGLARYYLGKLPDAAGDMRSFLGKTRLPKNSEQVSQALDIVQEFESQSNRRVGS